MSAATPSISPGRAAGITAIFIGFQLGGVIILLGAGAIIGLWRDTSPVFWSLAAVLLITNSVATACVLQVERRRQQLPWRFWPSTANPVAKSLLPVLAIIGGNLVILDLLHRLVVSVIPSLGVIEGSALQLYDITLHPITVPLALIGMAPITEELVFRGLILAGLLRTVRPHRAILISAACFALMHLNFSQLMPTFCMGLVLGWVYYRTQSLLLCMIGHAVHNTVVLYFTAHVISLGLNHTAVISHPATWPPWWFFAGGLVLIGGGASAVYRFTTPPASPVPPPLPRAN
ncbi:CPBP family intramembrane glutamic endopeptidase [Synoicihabitans lomoniglobus]|uniref:CPBP family intramembrane metalloprotease n=1 Tax=Synoicihabitans lomoniglobus TaxID=2909285 RepID=A0AAF0CMP1_9BACT|nr:CPBP family intramembrane metalloprotease [Opitutaceae bacterium LMO-M01]WED63576.1 CPBP family intramembrane metalloprotease [Opitutaceae bacterium LMO-M01]